MANDFWRYGVCKDHIDIFHPVRGETDKVNKAKALCRVCPVRWACLTYALENNEQLGVWGGFASKERRRLRREMKNGELILTPEGMRYLVSTA